MKICPYCEQDAVWRVRLKNEIDFRFSMCFECDTVWKEDEDVSDRGGSTFDRLMKSTGRLADWKNVERVGPVP